MKKIYDLKTALADDPSRVVDAQKLTLDKTCPHMGLAGSYGLFGSPDWWDNLNTGTIPIVIYEGLIESLQFEGMNNEGRSFTLAQTDAEPYTYSCVANQKNDLRLYEIGRKMRVTVFFEKKKSGDDLDVVWMIEIGTAKNEVF